MNNNEDIYTDKNPYLHNSYQTIGEMIEGMLGRPIEEPDIVKLKKFLEDNGFSEKTKQ